MGPSRRQPVLYQDSPYSSSRSGDSSGVASLKFASDHAVHAAPGGSGAPDAQAAGGSMAAALSDRSSQHAEDGGSSATFAAAGSSSGGSGAAHDDRGSGSASTASAAAWTEDDDTEPYVSDPMRSNSASSSQEG